MQCDGGLRNYPKRNMRTTLNLLLLNLTAADLMFVSIGIPFVCYHYAADNWLIGETICKLSQYIICVCIYATTSTLVSIAAVQFITIVLPANIIRLRTKKHIVFIVGIIWMITLLANIPILMIYKVKKFLLDITIEPYCYCRMTLQSHWTDKHVKGHIIFQTIIMQITSV